VSVAHDCNPVILATQNTETRRIKVQSQPQANISQDPIWKIPNTKQGSSDRAPA
jgi:hypothetical protein